MREDYETCDLWQAAFLICRGANLKKMIRDKIKPGRIIFCLAGENLERLAEDFYQSGEVGAILYKDCALNLKHEIFKFHRKRDEGRGDDDEKNI
jgi:hypothetical protein